MHSAKFLLFLLLTLTLACDSDDDGNGPAVQQTTEFGKLEATVNGQQYESTFAIAAELDRDSGFPSLTVTSAIGNNEQNISFLVGHTVDAPLEEGTYTFSPDCILGGGTHCLTGSYLANGQEYDLLDEDAAGDGTVTFAFYDRDSGKAVTGTFAMTLRRQSDGAVFPLTNGKFNVQVVDQ